MYFGHSRPRVIPMCAAERGCKSSATGQDSIAPLQRLPPQQRQQRAERTSNDNLNRVLSQHTHTRYQMVDWYRLSGLYVSISICLDNRSVTLEKREKIKKKILLPPSNRQMIRKTWLKNGIEFDVQA